MLFTVVLTVGLAAPALAAPTNSVLILYDSSGTYGWIGGIHAKLLANLMGHFDLPYQLKPVESYAAGDANTARAIFYLGLVYNNPLPAAFTNDVQSTTNPVCWFKYNLWQVSGTAFAPKSFDTNYGFRFLQLWPTNLADFQTNTTDQSYSNIVYKGETFLKNQLDPELGLVGILNSNLVSTPILAWRTNASNVGECTPYVVHASNFWYVADSPFDYMSEEDRYIAFADVLHDILGVDHPTSHRALIRIEDVSSGVYEPSNITQVADYLHSQSVPFALATISVYTDPLGAYNNGTPETHRISDPNDSTSVAFLNAVHYAISKGAQIIVHGYTHQYSDTNNPYSGTSADDFEFWREGFSDPTNYVVGIYQPVAEDSAAWATSRFNAAKTELQQAGLSWVAWETPHYTASAVDYQAMTTNFPLFMERSIYFADDYDPIINTNHLAGQFFPYVINRDTYGRKVMPENIGNFEPLPWADYPARQPADLIRSARKNLVVRDGWASAYFHGFYDLTNLQAMVTGIKALGYTYVPLVAASTTLNLTAGATATNLNLSFATQAGVNYHVEQIDALANSTWLELTNTIGTGNPITLPLPAAAAQRYFRLRVE